MNPASILKNRIAKNAGWIMAGRIFHIILTFVIGLLMARYLGPANYGLINYAAAYGTFFTAFCTLGINSVIVKDFIDHPEEQGTTIGTVLVMRLISSFLSFLTIAGISFVIDRNSPIAVTVTILYSVSVIFQIFDTFNYWFQSRLISKYYAIATAISYTIASAYKVVLLVLGMSVEWFAVSNSVDYMVLALVLFIFYKKNHGPKFSFSIKKGKEILAVSKSFILSSLMVAVYAATDKVMLKQMMDESQVGYYALAVSISTMWAFVLSAIIDSMKPKIMEYHNTNYEKYLTANKQMYALVFYVSLAASVVICLIAPLFVRIVYGESYLPSVTPLRIVVWYVAFSYLGVARDVWTVCERKQRYLKFLYFGSAALNVVLNLALIPFLGSAGAAIASLFTQISTVFLVPLVFRELRPNVRMMMDAVLLKGVLPNKKSKSYTNHH